MATLEQDFELLKSKADKLQVDLGKAEREAKSAEATVVDKINELAAHLEYKAKAEELAKTVSEYNILLKNIVKASTNTSAKMMGSQDGLYEAIKTAQAKFLQ